MFSFVFVVFVIIPSIGYCLRTFSFSLSLPRHNSDTGLLSRLLSALPKTVHDFIFIATKVQLALLFGKLLMVLRKKIGYCRGYCLARCLVMLSRLLFGVIFGHAVKKAAEGVAERFVEDVDEGVWQLVYGVLLRKLFRCCWGCSMG